MDIYLNTLKSEVFHLKSLGNMNLATPKKSPKPGKSGFSVKATPLPILGAKIQKYHRKVLEASSVHSSVTKPCRGDWPKMDHLTSNFKIASSF